MGENKPRRVIFNPSDANSRYLGRGVGVRGSAQGANIARVKSKEGEAKFPVGKQFETNPFDVKTGNILIILPQSTIIYFSSIV